MLHVVGNLCRDTTLLLDRFPEPGETLVAHDSRSAWGGKGLNQAVAAARAGAEAVLYAAVGASDMPAILAESSGEAWPVLHLEPLARPTDTSTVLVRADGENVIVSVTACARDFDPLAGSRALDAAAGDTVLMQGNLPRAVTEDCLRHARQRGARTVLNPSPLWSDAVDWRAVDLAVLNVGELERITGCAEPEAGARSLCDLGVETVVVTRGAHGAFALERDQRIAVPTPPVAVRDTSGAGDVLCGVLTAHVHRGADLTTALSRAVAAAALSVTRLGALASCPTADELTRLDRGEAFGSCS